MGLVFIAVGVQWTDFALILLLVHAIAKALLFMSVGSIITTTITQDVTEMGGLASRMPATTSAYLVGAAGLVGLLPLGMFWALQRGLSDVWDKPLLVGVLLTTNLLTGINLVRVFRGVFLGPIQPKTRRAAEVPWTMALPMVVLTVGTLVLPVVLQRLELLPPFSQLNGAAVLLSASGAIGVIIGVLVPISHTWARPIQPLQRFLQDLLAYDFYVDRFYGLTVVWTVNTLSQVIYWCDRYIVDGLVNLVGLASIFSGEGLKYSISGRSQAYVLTILVGVGLLGILLAWSKLQPLLMPLSLIRF
jgi:NAD(P)H-quinone oxidoreductase subunit 5